MDISFTKGLSQKSIDMDQDPTFIQEFQRNSHGLISFQDPLLLPSNTQNSEYCSIMPMDGRVSHENLMAMQTLKANKSGQGDRVTSRSPLQAREHVLAERSRREKMNQQFIALSAIIPGIKKMNKASIIEGTIKHLKELQEREKKLVGLTKKNTSSSSPEESIPDIVVRVSDNNVLVRIHSQKLNTGAFISKILNQIEKLHLVVINSRTVPFGIYAVDITVVARMDVEFCSTDKELVSNLRRALSEFI